MKFIDTPFCKNVMVWFTQLFHKYNVVEIIKSFSTYRLYYQVVIHLMVSIIIMLISPISMFSVFVLLRRF